MGLNESIATATSETVSATSPGGLFFGVTKFGTGQQESAAQFEPVFGRRLGSQTSGRVLRLEENINRLLAKFENFANSEAEWNVVVPVLVVKLP